MMRRENFLVIILFTVLVLIWGSAFILIKKSLIFFSPMEVGAGRIFFAFLTLLPFALRQVTKINRSDLGLIILSGVLGSFIPAVLFALAQATVSSGYAAILSGLTPVLTILVSVLFYNQRVVFLQVIGVTLSFAGAIVLLFQGLSFSNIEWLASSFIFLATLCYALNLTLIKFKLKTIHPMQIAAVSLLFIGPIAAAILYYQGFFDFNFSEPQFQESLFSLAILGITSTAIALVLFNRLLKIASPILASSITYAIPLVALSWGYYDGEQLTVIHLTGLSLILGGVYLIAKKQTSAYS